MHKWNLNRRILRLAVPNIISNISIPLLSAVDVALMGNISIVHLGAIGLGTLIFNFFFWNFGFLRMGVTGLVAQSEGKGNTSLVNEILSKGIYFSLIIAMFILLSQILIWRTSVHFLNLSGTHETLVWDYFSIRIWAAPASFMTYVFFGYLFGRQDAVSPMFTTVFINVLNILLSYYLVVIADYGIIGTALGTLIAEYSGLVVLVLIVFGRKGASLILPHQISRWWEFLQMNQFLFLRTVALTAAFAFFYRESSSSGELILAINVVLLQFLSWLSYGIDGFAFASESLVGFYFGAKMKSELRKIIQLSFKWGLLFAAFFAIIYFFYSGDIASIFSESNQVVTSLIEYRYWLLVLPFVSFVCYIWDGVFIGLGRFREMMITMFIGLSLYIVLYYGLGHTVENAIWISFVAFLSVRGILLSMYWLRMKHQIFSS